MVAHMSSGGRGTGERLRRSTVPVSMDAPKKKSVSLSAAWREARALVWAHRRRLLLGLALMLVSRLAGLVLPASSKYLIDDVVNGGRSDLLMPIALAAGAATLVQAVTSFAPGTDPRRRRAARDHRHAQARAGARHAPAGALLRFDADRRARLAHHVRRRRHQEPGRHRPRAARRRVRDGRRWASASSSG